MTSRTSNKAALAALLLAAALPALGAGAIDRRSGSTTEGPKVTDRSKESLTRMPSKSDLKPAGPMTIVSDSFEGVQGASAVYIGHVAMESETLKFDGDRAELYKQPDGHYQSKLTGGPAHLNHLGDGAENPNVIAHANAMTYDSRTGLVDLVGGAYVKRGDDEITGETIRYSVNERRIQAAGGGGTGQVRVVIQPPPSDAAPTPGPTPGTTPAPGSKP